MAFCPKCGAKTSSGASFCAACGARLSAPPGRDSAAAPAASPSTTPRLISTMIKTNPTATPGTNTPAPGSTAPETPAFTPPSSGSDAPAAPTRRPPLPRDPLEAFGIDPSGTTSEPPASTPTFTPPTSGSTTPAAPTRRPNPLAAFGTDPSGTTSAPAASTPTFTPPSSGSDAPPVVPKYTPPASTFTPSTPTFTPPAVSFTPPARTISGPVCYYHRDEPPVAKCACCGKFICQDCFDSYGVSEGEYAGQALCYDCTKDLVADNVRELKKQKRKIIALFIATMIGMGFGAMFFSESTVAGFICMFWFGSFWYLLKNVFVTWWRGRRGLPEFIGAVLGSTLIAPIVTIKKVIECIVFWIRTAKFIKNDSEALQQMTDYMEYTVVRNQNRGVDIETLLKENSSLANNSVAQMARTQSEEEIEAHMRGCLATINENGEIIRSFAA